MKVKELKKVSQQQKSNQKNLHWQQGNLEKWKSSKKNKLKEKRFRNLKKKILLAPSYLLAGVGNNFRVNIKVNRRFCQRWQRVRIRSFELGGFSNFRSTLW